MRCASAGGAWARGLSSETKPQQTSTAGGESDTATMTTSNTVTLGAVVVRMSIGRACECE